jgi:hypothetical protein
MTRRSIALIVSALLWAWALPAGTEETTRNAPPVGLYEFCALLPPPSEQSLVAFSIQPGSTIVIFGANFFFVPGQILIHLTDYLGNPLVLPLTQNFWSDGSVGGNIPPPPPAGSFAPGNPLPPPGTIFGVEVQTALFEVVTWCGQSGTASGPLVSATFTPFMDIEPLPSNFITCSMTSNNSGDSCQGQGGQNWSAECGPPFFGWVLGPFYTVALPFNAFFANHYSGWGPGNHGTDTFVVVPLANQWSVEAIIGFTVDPMHVDGSPDNSSGMWAKLSSASPPQNSWTVQWRQDACSLLAYSGLVSVTGPIGVPP